jgi:antirestriction protein ArdC
MVFFHELGHAAYERAMGKFQKERLWAEEIVAELSAQVLCQLVGKRTDGTLGNSYRYIERFARAAGLSPISACLRVIDDVEKVLSLILRREENSEKTTANDAEEDF